jgi:FMN phosphatase YigB (HAD superfamily)
MIELTVIFDLDSCLAAGDEPGPDLYEPAFRAIREANRGHISEAILASALQACWQLPFDQVAERFRFTDPMRVAGFRAFDKLAVTRPMHGYGDLHLLRELGTRRFLVTTGFRRLQESKVKALGIGELFDEVYIDAINEPDAVGKLAAFEALMRRHGLRAATTVVVGDNPNSEIAAGNSLGMTTIQILRPGVSVGGNATHTVSNLVELKATLRAINVAPRA